MHMKFFVMAIALTFVTACSDKVVEGAEKNITLPTKTEVIVKVPVTPFEKLISGETLTIVMDACDPQDGEKWDGKADPAGRLVCGTEYKLSYVTKSNRIMTSGLVENIEGGEHKNRKNGREWSGISNRINFWGGRATLSDEGEVFDRKRELIGHVVP